MRSLAKFLFEAGMLKKMRRTGYPFLGTGNESVADHSFRAALLGYMLALQQPELDAPKVALLLLHHDLAEARTGDLNYMQKRYAKADEEKAIEHQVRDLPEVLAESVRSLTREFNESKTPEAMLARDADQLDFLIELKEQKDLGNKYADDWIRYALKRLQTDAGKELAREILTTDWTEWWFEKRDDLWAPPNGENGDK
ncbi:HD domain-containing protein [Dethiosulfatarculus sandiegensis]|uniref:5'-deoxynucleotidase n=1 Tax=Dethiosulfatarculus sandiegensis TaxID=1429043 RepID=A0A0D2HQD9_9BACT|nr:HD domain-containing protein [Dethiosulfatarculus sandiegensis]KIX12703.1 phosphohydrolase [Dethiosulfatarculus sandiegensis]